MCGIVGIFEYIDAGKTVDEGLLVRMNERLYRRGPDDAGKYIDRNLGMAMRRLEIIDLAGGRQPIFNEDKSVVIVFNGEIYNYVELREELQKKGHKFYTNTDTEVIVHTYEEYGLENFVQHLNGMFAFALFDRPRRRLIVARDRFGIKPLFYAFVDGRFYFASEIKAIMEDERVPRSLDFKALSYYFTLNYIPTPHTIFSKVKKLEPGHILVIDEGKNEVQDLEYWDLKPAERAVRRSFEEYKEQFIELFKDSIRLRLRSDVPLGVFLSSGIDSTAITAFVAKYFNSSIDTFTIKFGDPSYDEAEDARLVADMYGTNHHELEAHPNVASIFDELVQAMDEPHANYGSIPFYYVCELARQHVKVTLSGNGGDEIFAGYPTLVAYKLSKIYRLLPRFLKEHIIKPAVFALPASTKRLSFDYKAKQFVTAADYPPYKSYMLWKVIFTKEEQQQLFTPEIYQKIRTLDDADFFNYYYTKFKSEEVIERLLYIDIKTFLLDVNLAVADRMSMWHSLENRVPFLDHRIAEFATRLPTDLKLKGTRTKHFLREAVRDMLPPRILKLKKKGFTPPLPLWLKRELRDFMLEILSEEQVSNTRILNYAFVKRVIDDHLSGKAENSRELWTLMVFVHWFNKIFK